MKGYFIAKNNFVAEVTFNPLMPNNTKWTQLLKGCACYINTILFFMSKREH